jgi:hypothetical protein
VAGQTGAVDLDIDARPRSAGRFDLSDLMLGVAGSGGFVPKAIFSTEEQILCQLEIRSRQPETPPAAPRVVIELAGTNATSRWSRPLGPANPGPVPGSWLAVGEIRLSDDLPAGDYVVRALVFDGTRNVGGTSAVLRKVRPEGPGDAMR